jgi:hypothetical protein
VCTEQRGLSQFLDGKSNGLRGRVKSSVAPTGSPIPVSARKQLCRRPIIEAAQVLYLLLYVLLNAIRSLELAHRLTLQSKYQKRFNGVIQIIFLGIGANAVESKGVSEKIADSGCKRKSSLRSRLKRRVFLRHDSATEGMLHIRRRIAPPAARRR